MPRMSRTASDNNLHDTPSEAGKPGRINIQIRRTGGRFEHLRSVSVSEAFLPLLERQLDAVKAADKADRESRQALRRAG